MKAKDYFLKLKAQGKITNEAFDKFVETIPEFDLPDELEVELGNRFMTQERAMVDQKLQKHFHAQLYDAVDASIAEILPSLDAFEANEINTQRDTFKKIKMLRDGFTKSIEKAKKGNPDESKKVKDLQTVNEELTAKIGLINTDWEKKLGEVQKKHAGEFKSFKIDSTLKGLIGNYQIADDFEDKDAVKRLIHSELVGKNHFDLSENGQILVQEIENGIAKPKFIGNDPVTIDKLLETAVKPFLKRNNGGEENNNGNTSGGGSDKNKSTSPRRNLAIQ